MEIEKLISVLNALNQIQVTGYNNVLLLGAAMTGVKDYIDASQVPLQPAANA